MDSLSSINEGDRITRLIRPKETHGMDPGDVEMKPASSGSPPAMSSNRLEPPLKQTAKRGKIRMRFPRLKRRKRVSNEEEPGALFGRNLSSLCQGEALSPQLMELLLTIYEHGPTTEGIFRRSPNASVCRVVKQQLDTGVDCGPVNIHVACSLLKEFLRSLPDCLLCSEKYDQWLESNQRKQDLRSLVDELPDCNRILLRHLICILHEIHRNSTKTRMNSNNLAVCFGPSLLWSKTATLDSQRLKVDLAVAVVQSFIDHAEYIFGAECFQLFQDFTRGVTQSGEENSIPRITKTQPSNDPTTHPSIEQSALDGGRSDHPIPPPRRKRFSVVVPVKVLKPEEFVHSVAKSSTDEGQSTGPDGHRFNRSVSLESENSGSEWNTKLESIESTDFETLEDSGSYEETTATEEELDERTTFSEDLADEDDDDAVATSPTTGPENPLIENQYPNKPSSLQAEDQSTANCTKQAGCSMGYSGDLDGCLIIHENSPTHLTHPQLPGASRDDAKVSLGFNSPLQEAATVTRMRSPNKNNGSDAASFSSQDDVLRMNEKLRFFGSSFSSDADLSTFGESMDGGTAFCDSAEFLDAGTIRSRRSESGNISSQSKSSSKTKELVTSGASTNHPDAAVVATEVPDRTTSDSKHQRCIHESRRSELGTGVGMFLGQSQSDVETTTDSRASSRCKGSQTGDTRDSGVSSTAFGLDQSDSPAITPEADTCSLVDSLLLPAQRRNDTSLVENHSRRLSLGSRVPPNQSGTEDRQRRGMTHRGSDFFPAHLSKTFRTKRTNIYDPGRWDCDSVSETESCTDMEKGKRTSVESLPSNGKELSDDKVIHSDVEISEACQNMAFSSSGRTVKYRGHADRVWDSGHPTTTCSGGKQGYISTGGSKKSGDAVLEEPVEPSRIRSDPPKHKESIRNQKCQKPNIVEEEALFKTDDSRTVNQEPSKKEAEKKKQGLESGRPRRRRLGSVGMEGLEANILAKTNARSCNDISKAFDTISSSSSRKANHRADQFMTSELRHVRSWGALSPAVTDTLHKRYSKPRSRRGSVESSSGSSSSSSGEENLLPLRVDDLQVKRRKRIRRPRKARNSDPRLQVDRKNNRVNLVRSKSDSNALCRSQLMLRNESKERDKAEYFDKHFDQRTFAPKSNPTGHGGAGSLKLVPRNNVRKVEDEDEASSTNETETLSTLLGKTRRTVALKDREWHKNLVQEVVYAQDKTSSSSMPTQISKNRSFNANPDITSRDRVRGQIENPAANKRVASMRSSIVLRSKQMDYHSSGENSKTTTDGVSQNCEHSRGTEEPDGCFESAKGNGNLTTRGDKGTRTSLVNRLKCEFEVTSPKSVNYSSIDKKSSALERKENPLEKVNVPQNSSINLMKGSSLKDKEDGSTQRDLSITVGKRSQAYRAKVDDQNKNSPFERSSGDSRFLLPSKSSSKDCSKEVSSHQFPSLGPPSARMLETMNDSSQPESKRLLGRSSSFLTSGSSSLSTTPERDNFCAVDIYRRRLTSDALSRDTGMQQLVALPVSVRSSETPRVTPLDDSRRRSFAGSRSNSDVNMEISASRLGQRTLKVLPNTTLGRQEVSSSNCDPLPSTLLPHRQSRGDNFKSGVNQSGTKILTDIRTTGGKIPSPTGVHSGQGPSTRPPETEFSHSSHRQTQKAEMPWSVADLRNIYGGPNLY